MHNGTQDDKFGKCVDVGLENGMVENDRSIAVEAGNAHDGVHKGVYNVVDEAFDRWLMKEGQKKAEHHSKSIS